MARQSRKRERVIAADEKTIWCLFSVDNNYDQPDNNLVAWWSEKPSLEVLFKALDVKISGGRDEDVVAAAKIWAGTQEQVGYAGTSYRLEQVPEGMIDG
jgi:hypothetical protein